MAIAENRNAKTPDKRLIWLIVISIAMTTGAAIGWIGVRQGQNKKIQQAQLILNQECQIDISKNPNALDSASKVNEATTVLQSVPNIPGLGYQEAQNELTNFSTCIKDISSTGSFLKAKALSQKALKFDESTTLSLEKWQPIRSDLAKAINLSKSIPQDTNISNQAKKQLVIYQNQLEVIDTNIQREQSAVNIFSQAEELNKTVDKLVNDSPKLESLSQADTKLRDAIKLIKTIPENTTISEQSNKILSIYQEKLNDVDYIIATKHLEALVKKFSHFAASLNPKIAYNEYVKQLKELKLQFDNIGKESSEIKTHSSYKALNKALNEYNDALVIQRYCQEGRCLDSLSVFILNFRDVLWLPESFPNKGVSFAKKYQIPVTSNIWRQKYFEQNKAKIWEKAEVEIQDARLTN
jgi:hypothetical protein